VLFNPKSKFQNPKLIGIISCHDTWLWDIAPEMLIERLGDWG
jgi:hypothetical protein